MVVKIYLDNFTDPQQIGWIEYKEGDCNVKLKVVRGRNGWPFISIPSEFKGGVRMPILAYENPLLQEAKFKAALEAFRLAVPADVYYPQKDSFDARVNEQDIRITETTRRSHAGPQD